MAVLCSAHSIDYIMHFGCAPPSKVSLFTGEWLSDRVVKVAASGSISDPNMRFRKGAGSNPVSAIHHFAPGTGVTWQVL